MKNILQTLLIFQAYLCLQRDSDLCCWLYNCKIIVRLYEKTYFIAFTVIYPNCWSGLPKLHILSDTTALDLCVELCMQKGLVLLGVQTVTEPNHKKKKKRTTIEDAFSVSLKPAFFICKLRFATRPHNSFHFC